MPDTATRATATTDGRPRAARGRKAAAPVGSAKEAVENAAAAATNARADAWRLNVLGPVELCYEGSLVDVSGLARSLLAVLARTPGAEVPTTSIIDNLWGSAPPADAENAVAQTVSRLRKALTVAAPDVDPTSVLYTMPTGYILHVGTSNVDAELFDRLVAEGRRALMVGQPGLAITRLGAALQLWRGAAYADYLDQPATRDEARRLEDLRLAALEALIESRLAVAAPGVPDGLLDELHGLLQEYWHRERLWVHLMTALFRLGRRGEALAACREAGARFVSELSMEPGAQLRAAEQAVLADDRSLFGVASHFTPLPRALTTAVPACIGRDEEIDWLIAALDMAATRRAQARLVVGSPGIGKSRLTAEVAQRAAARGVVIRYAHGEDGTVALRATLALDTDRLNLLLIDDLDLAARADLEAVVDFIRAHRERPLLSLLTCRDPVRVGDLGALPKLVLTALGDTAAAEIVQMYAPGTAAPAAAGAMVNAGGVPARIHRAASEWAFARAGRRIDRAAAAIVEPRRWLASAREEVLAGVLDLDHVRRSARPLRPVAPTVTGCPYPGMAGYDAADAELFHGRDAATARALAHLVEAPLLAVVGAAGIGKSSLVRAGVLPALSHGVLPDSAQWRHLIVTPSGAEELALSLTTVESTEVAEVVGGVEAQPIDTTTEALEPGDFEPSIESAAADAPADPPADLDAPAPQAPDGRGEPVTAPVLELPARLVELRPRTVVVVDQFEEAFTLLDASERAVLFDTLAAAAESGDVSVIVILRSDSYPRCAEHAELARLISTNTMLLAPMTSDELRQAIEEPAEKAGLRVERALAERLVADVHSAEPGGLLALSAALVSLWERRVDGVLRLTAYEASGGLARAVAQAGERAFGALPDPEQRVAAQRILVTLAERGWCPETELIHASGPGSVQALRVMHEYGIVTLTEQGTAELVHEALAVEWPRLAGWFAEAKAEWELRGELAVSARAWADSGRQPELVFGGARLAAALAFSERFAVSETEHDFLVAGQRILFAEQARIRRKVTQLWRVIIVLLMVLAASLAAGLMVFVAWHDATGANRTADAASIDVRAVAEPDPRQALRLALAADALQGPAATAATFRAILLRAAGLQATSGDAVTAVAVSPAGGMVAAGTTTGDVLVYDGDLASVRRVTYPDHGPVCGLSFTRDSRELVAWGGQRLGAAASIAVWDVSALAPVGGSFGQAWPGPGGGLLPDGDTLVLAQHQGGVGAAATVVAWSLAARTPSTAYPLPALTVTGALLVAADGSAIAAAGPGGTTVVDVASGHTVFLAGVTRPVALGHGILAVAAGPATQLWDVASRTLVGQLRQADATQDVRAATFSADGAHLVTAAADGTVVVWAVGSRALVTVLGVGPGTPNSTSAPAPTGGGAWSVVIGPDNRTVYTVDTAGTVLAWDLTGTRGVGSRAAAADTTGLVALACQIAGGDFSPAQWAAAVPGYAYQQVCST
jgi:DNA-binding SARP family transcriptional activator